MTACSARAVVPVLAGELAEQAGHQHDVGDALEDGVDELVLVAEVAVDDRLGDTCAAGDVVDREVRAGQPHGLDRGGGQLLTAGTPMLGPPRPSSVGRRDVRRWDLGCGASGSAPRRPPSPWRVRPPAPRPSRSPLPFPLHRRTRRSGKRATARRSAGAVDASPRVGGQCRQLRDAPVPPRKSAASPSCRPPAVHPAVRHPVREAVRGRRGLRRRGIAQRWASWVV